MDRYDPDLWVDELAVLNQPGQADIQSDLFYDYRTNVDAYPIWQDWLRRNQPGLLVIWAGTTNRSILESWNATDRMSRARTSMFWTRGHFVLDTKSDEVAALIVDFMNGRR